MAYADQQGMSTGRIVSIAAVLLLHAFLGYALVTGLAYEAVKNVKERLEVLDVEEEKPPEEEPPPPPPEDVFVPPPPVFTAPTPAPSNNNSSPPPPDPTPTPTPTPRAHCWDGSTAATASQCKPRPEKFKCWNGALVDQGSQCPPKPVDKSKKARPKNSKSRWVTTNDYPSRSLQREEEGTSRLNMTVGANGKVTACSASGATAALNTAACRFAKRRARFHPALDKSGNPTTGSYSTSVRWQIPPR